MVHLFARLTFWIGLAVAATLVVAGFGESQAKPFSGKIAFVASSGDVADLFVIHADGTRLRQLTRDAKGEGSPKWSPDGKSLAFIATTWQSTTTQWIAKSAITVMAANGSKRRVLFRSQSRQLSLYDLAWSPNGQQIAFIWYHGYAGAYELWLLRLDGSTDPFTSTSVSSPTWAPDGKRLAYNGLDGIFVANVRTRSARVVKGTEKSGCPEWSPNGRWIAVCTTHEAGAKRFQSLDVMSPTGAGRRQLVKGGAINSIAWAPKSDAILFANNKDDRGLSTRQLFIVSLHDGRVTPVPGTVGGGSASWHR
jgi:Tol biopolymer transport system component